MAIRRRFRRREVVVHPISTTLDIITHGNFISMAMTPGGEVFVAQFHHSIRVWDLRTGYSYLARSCHGHLLYCFHKQCTMKAGLFEYQGKNGVLCVLSQ